MACIPCNNAGLRCRSIPSSGVPGLMQNPAHPDEPVSGGRAARGVQASERAFWLQDACSPHVPTNSDGEATEAADRTSLLSRSARRQPGQWRPCAHRLTGSHSRSFVGADEGPGPPRWAPDENGAFNQGREAGIGAEPFHPRMSALGRNLGRNLWAHRPPPPWRRSDS